MIDTTTEHTRADRRIHMPTTDRGRPDRRAKLAVDRAVGEASLVESTSDAVIGVSPAGLITNWGAGARRLFGYESEEVIGRRIAMLAPREDPDGPTQLVGQVLAGVPIERMETERVTKDGRRLSVLLSLSRIADGRGGSAGVLGVYRDISAQRQAEADLKASEGRYQSVVDALSEGIVMQDRAGCVLAFNANAEQLLELPAGTLRRSVLANGDWSLVSEDGSALSVEEYPNAVCLRTGEPQRSVVLGVQVAGEIKRWLSANSAPLASADDREPYAAVASFTDITAQRKAIAELQTARLEDLDRLARVGEYRDDDTFRHTERVGRCAELIAIELRLGAELAWTIRRAAPLHDVGKIGIPDAILLKPAALTPQEFEVIKTHTTIGQRILASSHAPVLRMAAEIAATHHERWDGAGYPAGMRGDRIPIVGRIVAVADAFDAITHARPYKAASSINDAIAEIQRCSGHQFDPEVIAAFSLLEHTLLVDPEQRRLPPLTVSPPRLRAVIAA